MHRKKPGFTLLELLTVLTIIAILALIIIARIRLASQRAREDALKENLRQMRLAVQQFHSDVGGFPISLEQLVLNKTVAVDTLPDVDAAGNSLDPTEYHGPYFVPDRVPKDPFTATGEFGYDPTEGYVYSQAERRALDGSYYKDW
jgi:general secretion pathway protein G